MDLQLGSLPARRFPAAVEATAYFVISEALTNAARYAGTHRVRIDIARSKPRTGRAALVVRVRDDGRGGAAPDRGSGLRGLADRVALLDGTLEVSSPPDGGTTITAHIPLPDPERSRRLKHRPARGTRARVRRRCLEKVTGAGPGPRP